MVKHPRSHSDHLGVSISGPRSYSDLLGGSISSVEDDNWLESTNELHIPRRSLIQSNEAAARARTKPTAREALTIVVADAGLNAFGCCFVEVWALETDGESRLARLDGGHWMDPAFAQSLPSNDMIELAWGLDRTASAVPPGVGLVGTLAEKSGLSSDRIHWSQIKGLMDDPFVQNDKDNRMKKLYKIGLGIVGVASFNFGGVKGIVIFYSRPSADRELLFSETNEQFILISANLIGSMYAMREARQESVSCLVASSIFLRS